MTVYDIVPAGMDDVAAAGAEKGSSPKDVASKTDIVITMVPDGPEVEQAVLGPNGVLEGAKKGAIVVDMSSISPMVSQKVGAALRGQGRRVPRRAGQRRRAEGHRRHAGHHGGRQAGRLRQGGADPEDHGIDRDADRQGGRGQRDQAGESDHGGVQHRGDGRSAGAGDQGGARSRSRVQRRQGAAWRAARC